MSVLQRRYLKAKFHKLDKIDSSSCISFLPNPYRYIWPISDEAEVWWSFHYRTQRRYVAKLKSIDFWKMILSSLCSLHTLPRASSHTAAFLPSMPVSFGAISPDLYPLPGETTANRLWLQPCLSTPPTSHSIWKAKPPKSNPKTYWPSDMQTHLAACSPATRVHRI